MAQPFVSIQMSRKSVFQFALGFPFVYNWVIPNCRCLLMPFILNCSNRHADRVRVHIPGNLSIWVRKPLAPGPQQRQGHLRQTSVCLLFLPSCCSAPPHVGWGPTGGVWSAAPGWMLTVRPFRGQTLLRSATSVPALAGEWGTGAR